VLKQIPFTAVVVGDRLRDLDEVKVLELMESYQEVGQINPISLDEDLLLMAGRHRADGKDSTHAHRFAKTPVRQHLMTQWIKTAMRG
jgi:hypothetical protein